MTQQLIGLGTADNDGTGDPEKTAGQKINANFTELYSDRWNYVRLSSDFSTSSATAVDVTNLFFTPVANTRYEVSGIFYLRVATTTIGPRPGLAWPTGLTDGVAILRTPATATTFTTVQGNPA